MDKKTLFKLTLAALLFGFYSATGAAAEKTMIVLSSSTYDSTGDDIATAIAVGPDENIYVTGYKGNDFLSLEYSKTLVQGPSKIYSNGQSGNRANGIAIDSMGNIIVAGRITNASLDQDYFTLKYSPNFVSELSSAVYDSGNYDEISDIKIDSKDNIFVTGYSFDGVTNNFYTIKYDSDLNELGNAGYDSGGKDQAAAMAIDSNDNIIVVGFSDISGVNKNYFIRKYDNNLNILYSTVFDTGGDDRATSVAVDGQNNIIVAGREYDGATTINFLTLKYDSLLNIVSSTVYDSGFNDIASGVIADSNNDIIVTGYSGPNFSGNDYLTIRYDENFTIISTAVYNGGGRR